MSTIRYAMKMKRRTLSLLGAASVVALMLSATSSPALAQSGSADPNVLTSSPIEGTWIVRVHRVTQGITFTALQSFTAGGVALATGAIDRTPPPPISPIYGSWQRTGVNNYAVTIYFFVFDLTGNAVAMIKNNESFRVNEGNYLEGSGAAYVCDTNGENCMNVHSPITITGKRVVPQGATE